MKRLRSILIELLQGIAVILLFIALSHCDARCQDVLGYFLSGSPADRMTGGNIFSGTPEFKPLSLPSAEMMHPVAGYEYRFDNLYKEELADGDVNQAQRYSRAFSLSLPLQYGMFSPVLDLSVISTSAGTRIAQDSGEAGDYASRNNVVNLSYAMRLSSAISISADVSSLSDGNHSFTNGNAMVTFDLGPRSAISFRTGNIGSFNLLQLTITGVDGVLPLHIQKSGFAFAGQTALERLSLAFSFEQSSLLSVPDVTEENNTRFLPQGTLLEAVTGARYDLRDNVSLMIGGKYVQATGAAKFLSGSSSYGNLSSFGFNSAEVHAGVRYGTTASRFITGDLQWQRLSGGLRGYVESWPFVSIFDALVSSRENFGAAGSLEYLKVHLGGTFPMSDNITIGLGNNLLHAMPSLTVETWQPKYIIFGVRAYDKKELDIRSLDLMIASAGMKMRLGGYILTYSINQFVPLHIDKGETASGSGSAPSQPGTGTTQTLKTSGGQFHQLSVVYEF